jgi:hypothetical protein
LRAGSPSAPIVIHHDDRWCRLDRGALKELDVQLVEPPSAVAWGEFSQLAMVLRLLEQVSRTERFDWLVLISGQDYPVRPIAEIERSLGAADVDAFIGTGRCDRPPWRRNVGEFGLRYYYRWRPVPAWLAGPSERIAWRTFPFGGARRMPSGVWVGVRAARTPFGPDLVC